MPTVYIHPVSQPSRTLLWFARYAGLDVEFKTLDIFKGESKTEEYVAKFPAGQVPTYEDGDFYLEESIAILKLLADGHETAGGDAKRAARVNMMLARHLTVARKLTVPFFVTFALGKPEEKEEKLKEQKGMVEDILKKYDEILGKSKFIAGDELSLADFMFVPEVDQLAFMKDAVGDMLEPHKNLQEYLGRMKELKGYEECWNGAVEVVKAMAG